MEIKHEIRLTSAEITSLWQNYIIDSMSICVFQHFLEHIDDPEIGEILEHAMKIAKEHVDFVDGVFNKEGIPIPKGFSDKDVNLTAPRLFQDTFYLNYLKIMTKGALATYAAILPNIVKKEIREFYSRCLESTSELFNKSTELSLSKGIEIRPPYIPYEREVDYIQKQSFLSGWFGEQRPLTGFEVMHLYSNVQTAKMVQALMLGFGQVAKSRELTNYFIRGKEITSKHIEIFSKNLSAYDLPVPMTWDHEVTTSTTSPFSDKLLMFHISVLNTAGIGNYGVSLSLTQRRDIAAIYTRLFAEICKYAEDGANILIDKEWMERPPHAADREELIKHKIQK
ncbi:DUF3231 family protein [Anaerobacillus sp. MEB173]|uniref:DUF3231 family protein n=1 Tax=Anaerobacillus sp. MEB173 TaxID=3383345 RepID=UPI003F914617